MKRYKFRIITLLLLLSLSLSACSLDELDEFNKSYENPTPSVSEGTEKITEKPDAETVAPDASAENKITDAVQATKAPLPDSPDTVPTASPEITATPVIPTPTAALQPENTDSVATPTPASTATATPVPPTPTATPRDVADREEYRAMTFLIWAPLFEYGVFSGQDAGNTYDYAIFTEVSDKDVADYKAKLKKAGFTTVISDSDKLYKVMNDDSWCVTIEYSKNRLVLGSGFDESAQSEDDTLRSLYSDTMLQYIPRFNAGKYESSETEADESNFTYIYYSNVTENDVRDYIDSLEEAGYEYGTDEGDMDGIIWYMAMNEEVMSCYVAYDNGIVKIGCGYGE